MSTQASRRTERVKRALATLIVVSVVVFFWRALEHNWHAVSQHSFTLNYPLLLISLIGVLGTSLLSTYAWQLTINALSHQPDMTFGRSVATVNTTGLTKYLPGKFWSYALQMYWLSRLGYSRALVLYANLVNLAVSLVTGILLAVGLLLAVPEFRTLPVAGAFLGVLMLDAVCVLYHGRVVQFVAPLVRRVLRRDLGEFALSTKALFAIHGAQFAAQIAAALGGYALCYAVGYQLDLGIILQLMAALILADTAGFLFFLVPAGLGVREATMYFLLKDSADQSLAVVFPLITRLASMAADVSLGAFALWLLRRSARSDQAVQNARH